MWAKYTHNPKNDDQEFQAGFEAGVSEKDSFSRLLYVAYNDTYVRSPSGFRHDIADDYGPGVSRAYAQGYVAGWRAAKNKRSNFNRLYLAAERRRIARDRLKKKGPHAFKADVLGGMTVLVHPSTKRPGYWQATFFARDGEPWGDSESPSWEKLLDHIHGDSVDWRTAEPV